jgi:hypothetical protein
MQKSSNEKRNNIEIQKGPIKMDQRSFPCCLRDTETILEDMRNMEMRVDCMTLTKHEPKI